MSVAGFLREAEALRRLVCKEERETRRRELRDPSGALRDHMNAQLEADIIKVQQQLQKLKTGVFRFQEQLMDLRPSPGVIDKLRETMSDIENSISAFKDSQHQSFEELLKDERSVWQEICVLQRKMESWSVSVRAEAGGRRSEKPSAGTSLPAEVTALQTFLQQTGRDGGWDPFDHRSFLKVWTKHRGKPSYRPEARLYLPEKTEEELKRHEDWLLELRRLQDDKREAIRRWRAWKQTEREQRDGDEEPEEDQDQDQDQDQEERRRQVSERLEAWRRHRTQQREQQQEQSLREQILESRRAKEQRRRQLELKLLVEEHLQQKKEQEEQRLLEREAQEQAERQERQQQAVLGIRRFQERDSRRLEEKLQEKKSKEQEQSERHRTLEKLKEKVHIDRDPSRLWKLTIAWQERTKETGPSGTGAVSQIFHRAVPAWRQDS